MSQQVGISPTVHAYNMTNLEEELKHWICRVAFGNSSSHSGKYWRYLAHYKNPDLIQANAIPIISVYFQSNHDDSGFYTVPRVNDVLLALLICKTAWNKVSFIGLGNMGMAKKLIDKGHQV